MAIHVSTSAPSQIIMPLDDRVYLMSKAHLGFTGTKEELDERPDIRAKYLEV